jgi:Holliday junction resolvase RusA-like endonuclease
MVVRELILECPTYVVLPMKTKKDKKISINLNTYRNLHFLVESKAKKLFKEIMRKQLEGIEIQTPVEVSYKVYKASNRRLDKMNVISITSKYLMDAITEFGCWEDDDDTNIKKEILLPTEVDKKNPRIVVEIKSI